jgi:hypothetical protein
MSKNVSVAVSIVEDDGPARRILAGWINRAKGFHCVGEHGSAESALEHLSREKPEVVLIPACAAHDSQPALNPGTHRFCTGKGSSRGSWQVNNYVRVIPGATRNKCPQ